MCASGHTIFLHGRLLGRPDRQPYGTAQSVGYELGGMYQLDARHCLLVASMDEQGGGDKCVGNDAFIFSRLSDIRAEEAIPLNWPQPDYTLKGGETAWLSKGPATGCMVPLGAVLDDGSPHPGAGNGLLSATCINFNADGTSIVEESETLLEFLQLRWDGAMLHVTRELRETLLGFKILAQGITAYLPDGAAVLAPFLTTQGLVVFRYACQDGGWVAVAHGEPFMTNWNGQAKGAVDYMHSGESEPSIARADGYYWVYTRGGESNPMGRLYRSTDGLDYQLFLESPNHTVPQPMSQGLQGELYVATNPFPGPDGPWLRNPLMVKTFTGDGFSELEIVHDEGGIRDDKGDKIPFIDHAAGSTVYLEGRWRHFLLYRVCDLKERTPYAFQTDLQQLLGKSKPRSETGGLYLAEFTYDRVTHTPFRFAQAQRYLQQPASCRKDRTMISEESREYWRKGRMNPQFGAPGNEFNLDNLRLGMGMRQEPADRDVQCLRSQIDHIPCEWVVAPGADPDLRLLYLHGGGYVSGSGANYLPLAADISAAAQCAVLLPDYRLAPEHRFPAGLEDCVQAYEWMLASGPYGLASARATFIAGDSAGGGLTLATLLALRDRGLPLPKGGIALSAFTDLTLASESIHSQAENELFMHPDCLPGFVELYVSPSEVRNPLASPVFGDYRGIPPLLIQVGEYEVIRDDSVRVAARARADGVDVTLEVWPGQVHVFQIRELPESREAIAHIADFMRSCNPVR